MTRGFLFCFQVPGTGARGAVTQVCWQAVEEQPSQCQRTGCLGGLLSVARGLRGSWSEREPPAVQAPDDSLQGHQ